MAAWLTRQGWRIVAARAASGGGGEVDLVAVDPGGVLVGVEVRARRSLRAGTGAETVDAAKIRRLRRSLVAIARDSGIPIAGMRLDLVTAMPAAGIGRRWRLRRIPVIDG